MIKILLIVLLAIGCIRKTNSEKPPATDTTSTAFIKTPIQYEQLKAQFNSADSVVLLSHHSPNMPIKNPVTGEYFAKSIPFISDGKINYSMSVQERKQLNAQGIKELADILSIPAINDGPVAGCFQPRNAVVLFKQDRMACFDFCFDCLGYNTYGDFNSGLVMNSEKYEKLYSFYKKHGFKYEME